MAYTIGHADLPRLRKIALRRQGLLHDASFGRGKQGALRAIEHIGYVQIDTISVVERAHHHVWRSRVPNFTPALTDELLADRTIFEYWAHAAAYLPMRDYRYLLPMKRRFIDGEERWVRSRDTKLMSEVLTRIRSEGPLRSRDLDNRNRKRGGWWDWHPAKRAVEQLFMQGDLMITARDGFQKSYDLTEHVLPPGIDTRMPTLDECASHLIDQALGCHGFVTLKGVTYGRRGYAELREAVKSQVRQRIEAGTLEALQLSANRRFLAAPGLLDVRAPQVADTVRFLSPFDNSVIQRERLDALFAFDYQIECYVPAANRKYGYFCLPVLYRDRFVGRMDCKAHRKSRMLEIRHLHFEHGLEVTDALIEAFVRALPAFVEFQACDDVTLTKVTPASMKRPLAKAIAATL